MYCLCSDSVDEPRKSPSTFSGNFCSDTVSRNHGLFCESQHPVTGPSFLILLFRPFETKVSSRYTKVSFLRGFDLVHGISSSSSYSNNWSSGMQIWQRNPSPSTDQRFFSFSILLLHHFAFLWLIWPCWTVSLSPRRPTSKLVITNSREKMKNVTVQRTDFSLLYSLQSSVSLQRQNRKKNNHRMWTTLTYHHHYSVLWGAMVAVALPIILSNQISRLSFAWRRILRRVTVDRRSRKSKSNKALLYIRELTLLYSKQKEERDSKRRISIDINRFVLRSCERERTNVRWVPDTAPCSVWGKSLGWNLQSRCTVRVSNTRSEILTNALRDSRGYRRYRWSMIVLLYQTILRHVLVTRIETNISEKVLRALQLLLSDLFLRKTKCSNRERIQPSIHIHLDIAQPNHLPVIAIAPRIEHRMIIQTERSCSCHWFGSRNPWSISFTVRVGENNWAWP